MIPREVLAQATCVAAGDCRHRNNKESASRHARLLTPSLLLRFANGWPWRRARPTNRLVRKIAGADRARGPFLSRSGRVRKAAACRFVKRACVFGLAPRFRRCLPIEGRPMPGSLVACTGSVGRRPAGRAASAPSRRPRRGGRTSGTSARSRTATVEFGKVTIGRLGHVLEVVIAGQPRRAAPDLYRCFAR